MVNLVMKGSLYYISGKCNMERWPMPIGRVILRLCTMPDTDQ